MKEIKEYSKNELKGMMITIKFAELTGALYTADKSTKKLFAEYINILKEHGIIKSSYAIDFM